MSKGNFQFRLLHPILRSNGLAERAVALTSIEAIAPSRYPARDLNEVMRGSEIFVGNVLDERLSQGNDHSARPVSLRPRRHRLGVDRVSTIERGFGAPR
jgi:hypothetical protein